MARVEPLLEADPASSQVVVTRFECGNLLTLLTLRAVHVRIKSEVRRQAAGLIGVTTFIDWRSRTMLSISLWQNFGSIYSMGNVPQHVSVSRLPGRLGVTTTCGIFSLTGDWRRAMFRSDVVTRSPLDPFSREPASTRPGGKDS
jgi:hypothetical protein